MSGTDTGLIERALSGLGIDTAVSWTAAARIWSMLAGPVSVVLVATRLSAEEQGFYYTFASIVSFQVMFELGLGLVILQFASHEKAFLQWQADGTLSGSNEGDDVEKGRLAALFRKALRWYAVASALNAAALLVGGTLFFALRPTTVRGWELPWVALGVLAGGSLLLTPFLSLLEGCGLVADVARVRLSQTVASHVAAWTMLLAGAGLWASPAITAASLIVGGTWLFRRHRRFFADLARTRGGGISWRNEVWPFQWRVAVSWISSYFIFHLFIPVLFASRGAVAAGQMGMSLALATAVFTISNVFVTTRVPQFGELIARRDVEELDARFFPAMWRSFAVMAVGAAALFTGVFVLHAVGHRWSTRLLPPLPFALLLLATLANTIFFAEAVYLRAHKQEPLLGVFVASGVAIAACTLVLGRAYGATGMMIGYFVVTLLVSAGGGTWVFLQKRREWYG